MKLRSESTSSPNGETDAETESVEAEQESYWVGLQEASKIGICIGSLLVVLGVFLFFPSRDKPAWSRDLSDIWYPFAVSLTGAAFILRSFRRGFSFSKGFCLFVCGPGMIGTGFALLLATVGLLKGARPGVWLAANLVFIIGFLICLYSVLYAFQVDSDDEANGEG